jgi:ubiquitin C-terminal hydrolase
LNLAFADESLDDYQCDACKTQGKAAIRNRISRLPDTIILTLKRFTNTMQKVAGKVVWDIDGFDFRPWMAFKGDPFNKMYTPPVYETTALIEQQGSFRGGHYRMYAKQEQQWYEYDDNAIQNVPGETATNCDTYIAFLSRKNKLEMMNLQMLQQIQRLRAPKPQAAAEA